MDYGEAVNYILKEMDGIDLREIDIEKCIEALKPKEEAAV